MAAIPTDTSTRSRLFQLIEKHEVELLKTWIKEQIDAHTVRTDLIKESELREQSREFLGAFRNALQTSDLNDITQPGWSPLRDFLKDLSRRRAAQGFNPSETAMFVFSLRAPPRVSSAAGIFVRSRIAPSRGECGWYRDRQIGTLYGGDFPEEP
jgi:hypothetical protein